MAKTRKNRRMMEQHTYTVEYSSMGRMFTWKGSTYGEAVRRHKAVINLGYSPEIWRESDWECVTRHFDALMWS